MGKYEIFFIISVTVSTALCNVTRHTKLENTRMEMQSYSKQESERDNLKSVLFNQDLISERTEATIVRRIARQTGYNYDKPKVPFDLPNKPTEATVSVTPRPAPAPNSPSPLSPADDYSYPSPPKSLPAPPASGSSGYEASKPITPAGKQDDSYDYKAPASVGTSIAITPAAKQDDSYDYKAPASIGISTGGSVSISKPTTDGSYSYDAGFNPDSKGPSSPSIEVVMSSTGGPAYLPPKPAPGPSSSRPPALYEQPSRGADISIPSSTPGEPYLPPKLDSPAAPQQLYNAPTRGTPSRPNKPSSSYGTPPREPIKIPNSYLAPKGNSPSKPKTPGNSYVPPSPSGFKPSPRPQAPSVSTPANDYLPPYN